MCEAGLYILKFSSMPVSQCHVFSFIVQPMEEGTFSFESELHGLLETVQSMDFPDPMNPLYRYVYACMALTFLHGSIYL